MRIRKSQVLFPSYLSFTVPLSDPNLINRSPVMVQLNDAATTTTHHASAATSSLERYHPSDQTLPPIGKPSNGYDPPGIGESGAHKQHNKQQPLDEDVRKQYSGDSEEKHNSHFRKGGIVLGSEIAAYEVLPPSRPSSTQDGRWYEGEKGIPLKKRRGGFENNGNNLGNSSKKMKAKMKTKLNKKCLTQNDNDDDMDWEEEDEKRVTKPDNVNNSVGKKRGKGSAVMEGSRCSRVNGRGWRCCQQTLVGYALCEHHLGKGRLRSMSSVRSRSIATSTTVPDMKVHDGLSQPLSGASSFPENQAKCDSDETLVSDEKKAVIVTKRRMKLGMVKARSISSLLGQTKNTDVALEDNR